MEKYLPAKQETVIKVIISPIQRRIYSQQLKNHQSLSSGSADHQRLGLFHNLSRTCSHPLALTEAHGNAQTVEPWLQESIGDDDISQLDAGAKVKLLFALWRESCKVGDSM
jgi:hypothetical protein